MIEFVPGFYDLTNLFLKHIVVYWIFLLLLWLLCLALFTPVVKDQCGFAKASVSYGNKNSLKKSIRVNGAALER